MRKNKIFFLAVIAFPLLLSKSLFSDGIRAKDPENVKLDQNYLKSCVSDTKRIFTSPASFTKKEYVQLLSAAALTSGLYFFTDKKLAAWADTNQTKGLKKLSRFSEHFGDGLYVLPGLSAFYLSGFFASNDKAVTTSLLAAESLLISTLFTFPIKFVVGRERPNDGNDIDHLKPLGGFKARFQSFPSGHSQTAFSVATVIASKYQNIWFIPPVSYTLASLAALSRVYDKKHFPSDVFAGSAIGYFTAKTVLSYHSGESNVSFMPVIYNNGYYLKMSYKF